MRQCADEGVLARPAKLSDPPRQIRARARGRRPAIGRVARMAHEDPVSLYEGLLTTRAIRRYTDEKIPDEALRDILFAATRAPSGSNRQPFRFVVLRDGSEATEAKRLIGVGAGEFWGRPRRPRTATTRARAPTSTRRRRAWRAPCSTTSTTSSRSRSWCWPVTSATAVTRRPRTGRRSTPPARTCSWPRGPSATAGCSPDCTTSSMPSSAPCCTCPKRPRSWRPSRSGAPRGTTARCAGGRCPSSCSVALG